MVIAVNDRHVVAHRGVHPELAMSQTIVGRLEPCDSTGSRTVLTGPGHRRVSELPDQID